MLAYRKNLTVQDPNHVILSGLPLHKGQYIEVVVIASETEPPSKLKKKSNLAKFYGIYKDIPIDVEKESTQLRSEWERTF